MSEPTQQPPQRRPHPQGGGGRGGPSWKPKPRPGGEGASHGHHHQHGRPNGQALNPAASPYVPSQHLTPAVVKNEEVTPQVTATSAANGAHQPAKPNNPPPKRYNNRNNNKQQRDNHVAHVDNQQTTPQVNQQSAANTTTTTNETTQMNQNLQTNQTKKWKEGPKKTFQKRPQYTKTPNGNPQSSDSQSKQNTAQADLKLDGFTELSAQMINKLHKSTYECMICYDSIKRNAPIWACTNCYVLFHVKCIQAWREKSIQSGI